MTPVSMKALLEAGAHFGHQTRRWDPRMKPFIFTQRNGIHMIELQQTVRRKPQARAELQGRIDILDAGHAILDDEKRLAKQRPGRIVP